MSCSGTAMGHRTRTVSKGVEITFHSLWVDEEMSMGSAYAKESIRIGDKTATAKALVDLSAVATDSFQGKSRAEHSGSHAKEGLTTRKNSKFTGKVNPARMVPS